MPSIIKIRELYVRSFNEMTSVPEPRTYEECRVFTDLIEQVSVFALLFVDSIMRSRC